MAGAKLIKKRIISVRNTCKITRTMEMVSTSKSKRLVNRLHAALPYRDKLMQLLGALQSASERETSPYLRQTKPPRKCALLVVSSNRGLCGGYNANVLREAREYYEKQQAQDRPTDLYVIGKKGVAFFRFAGIDIKQSIIDIDDNFKYPQAEKLAEDFICSFMREEYDRVDVASIIYYSAGSQNAGIRPLLPITWQNNKDSKAEANTDKSRTPAKIANYEFSPPPEIIFNEMLPLIVKTGLYSMLLEAMASEQIYRRIAMKNATDAANDMLKNLTRSYNRARQALITQELAEIVAGADAL